MKVFTICLLTVLLCAATWNFTNAADAESKTDQTAAAAVNPSVDDAAEDDPSRIKRQHETGKSGLLGSLFSGILNKKLGLFGSLSSSSSSSSSSSKGADSHFEPPVANHPPLKPFDWFTFKKTILASLLQAVKAITGGVIALNGQLVKVKGHLLAAKGHFLSHKGDAITNFGRHLATNAFGAQHESPHDGESIIIPPPSAPSASLPSSSGFGSAPDFGISGPGSTYGGNLVPGFKNEYISAVEYPAGYYQGPHPSYSKRIESRQASPVAQKADANNNVFKKSIQDDKPIQRVAKVKPIVVRSAPSSIYQNEVGEEQQPKQAVALDYVPAESNVISNNIERQLEPEEYNFGQRQIYNQQPYYQG